MKGVCSDESLGTGLNSASMRCSVVRRPYEFARRSSCTWPALSAYGKLSSSSGLSAPTYRSSSRANRVLKSPLLERIPDTDARISPLRSGGDL